MNRKATFSAPALPFVLSVVYTVQMQNEIAILAGGCFWGMQDILRKVPGVLKTQVGYTGGHKVSPRYEDLKSGQSGHAEAIRIEFDPKLLSFEQLLEVFFKMHDPTSLDRQGNDIGSQYRSEIFYTEDSQKEAALHVIQNFEASNFWKKPIVTKVSKASEFYSAEEEHQDYLEKHPGGYTCHYLR